MSKKLKNQFSLGQQNFIQKSNRSNKSIEQIRPSKGKRNMSKRRVTVKFTDNVENNSGRNSESGTITDIEFSENNELYNNLKTYCGFNVKNIIYRMKNDCAYEFFMSYMKLADSGKFLGTLNNVEEFCKNIEDKKNQKFFETKLKKQRGRRGSNMFIPGQQQKLFQDIKDEKNYKELVSQRRIGKQDTSHPIFAACKTFKNNTYLNDTNKMRALILAICESNKQNPKHFKTYLANLEKE